MGREMHTGLWYKNLKERYHLEDISTDGRITLKWSLTLYLLTTTIVAPPRNARNANDNLSCLSFGNAENF
jgi:hypothetical protein